MPFVIGLSGPEGAGKSTAARELQASLRRAAIIPFAAPLKRMLEAIGVPAECLYGTPADKEKPLDLLGGKSARKALQLLGTEWGRDLIDRDLWINAWRHAVAQSPYPYVIADDVRFPNEVEAIHKLGGLHFCVIRSPADFDRVPAHASEDFAALGGLIVVNNGSREKLRSQLVQTLRHFERPKHHAISA